MTNPVARIIAEQKRLLRLEYEAEKESFSRITHSVGLTRLAARGDAWLDITVGRIYYNSLNQRVVEIFRNEREEEEDHHFEPGRQVAFFIIPDDPAKAPEFPVTGSVSFADGGRLVIAVSESANISILTDTGRVGIMLSFDETTYRAMFEALARLENARGRLGELRDLFYSRQKVGFLTLAPMKFPYLNDSQDKAVNLVLCAKDVAIVHGPPGTGKTTTLVEAIAETLRRESQVLVCAQSNMAVDWICEKLVDRGINVLRIGNPSRVNDKMLAFTYERRFEDHPDYPTLWSIRKSIRELKGSRRRNSEQITTRLDRLHRRAVELEIRINNDIFNSANVIASTLVGSASRILSGMKFSTLFIDEAAQALEPAAWIPMRRAGRLVLAGDHCQLPPTVKSIEALRQGFGISLMERLVDLHPEAVSLLTLQYRMNEDIMRFSSQWFYNGLMQAAPEARFRGILDFDIPIEWIDTSEVARENEEEAPDSFREAIADENFGRINKDEARLTLISLQAYISKIGKQRFLDERLDIGLITPYRAQARYLRHLLKHVSFFKPFRHLISVDTVDGFQGQERDIIVISLVRSNSQGDIGFLRDLRRMNVAMTRARMKLLIIGNVPTLTSHLFYRKLHRYILSLKSDL